MGKHQQELLKALGAEGEALDKQFRVQEAAKKTAAQIAEETRAKGETKPPA
ncbi:unnamed protein product [marine sediment metagenome]|uniref:Uncharacterized protein n=1 Tax=marine sediment metagenome TaxID=412755 RepID=X1GU83_9ZZZZ